MPLLEIENKYYCICRDSTCTIDCQCR